MVIYSSEAAKAANGLERLCEIVAVPADATGLNLNAVLQDLAGRQINELHVEAGSVLAGSLISQGLVDEMVLYTAPVLLGSDGRELVRLTGIDKMADRPEFEVSDVVLLDRDLRVTLTPQARQ